jgi:hypothetical protein
MTTNPFRFDGTISLGHMLLIFTLIVSAVAAWMANRERSMTNAAAIERMAGEMHDLESRVRAIEKE